MTDPIKTAAPIKLTDREFTTFQEMIQRASGILYAPGKIATLTGRIKRRLKALDLPTVAAYLDYLRRDREGELELLIDEVTTNETYFFRAPEHWELYVERILKAHQPGRRPLAIWSAAASRGPEPYSAAILAEEHLSAEGSAPAYTILATDISTQSLAFAAEGLYGEKELRLVQPEHRRRYFTREGEAWRFDARIRSHVDFRIHNLLHPAPQTNFDVVFLRNVMIYFDKPVKERVLAHIHRAIRPGGHLFLGESEALAGVKHDFRFIEPSFYRRES